MRSSRSQIWAQTVQPAGGVSPKNIWTFLSNKSMVHNLMSAAAPLGDPNLKTTSLCISFWPHQEGYHIGCHSKKPLMTTVDCGRNGQSTGRKQSYYSVHRKKITWMFCPIQWDFKTSLDIYKHHQETKEQHIQANFQLWGFESPGSVPSCACAARLGPSCAAPTKDIAKKRWNKSNPSWWP